MGTSTYDAVVIGAGPAGCMAALAMSRRGVRTLVVEKASRRRWKVCGCCLGAMGQRVLREAGLQGVLAHAMPVHSLRLAANEHATQLSLSSFVSISRETLDSMLADAAGDVGVQFLWNTSAAMSPCGEVTLRNGGTLAPAVVIDASGLGGQRKNDSSNARVSRIGLGWTGTPAICAHDGLTIALAGQGYLGRVALPDGRVDFAAAVDPLFLRAFPTPTDALREIWTRAGLDPAEVPDVRWRGTPPLRRRISAQHGRILRVGDALGYVEPLTGEGMSWALLAASRVYEDAIACIEHGPKASAWPARSFRMLAARRVRCGCVCTVARLPGPVSAAIRLSKLMPTAAATLAACLSGASSNGSNKQSRSPA